MSRRVHSRYTRCLLDLPLARRPVKLLLIARRFRCDTVLCARRIFAERFDAGTLLPWGRRTARLDTVVHPLGLALAGRPAASFARRILVSVSKDTLLRAVRRRGSPSFVPPTVIGIDDWAWRYGTLWSNGETQGQITKLKAVKRQMYGLAKLDLLEARLIGAT